MTNTTWAQPKYKQAFMNLEETKNGLGLLNLQFKGVDVMFPKEKFTGIKQALFTQVAS